MNNVILEGTWRGKLGFLFSIEHLTGIWLDASGMTTSWMEFPTICNEKSGCQVFSGRTNYGDLSTLELLFPHETL
jgi:hypothetical protein